MTFLPPEVSPSLAIILIVVSYFTSALTAVVGVGGGIFLIGVMASFLSPAIVIPIHAAVQLGSNTGRAALMRRDIDWRIAGLFALGATLGIVVAAQLFVSLTTQTLQLLLGSFILIAIWIPKFRASNIPLKVFPAVGAVATFCTMFVGATGPFIAAFLSPIRLGRHRVVATAASCMITQHVLKIIVFGFLGFQFSPWLFIVGMMIVSGFLGTLSGRSLLERIPEKLFGQVFRGVITLLALRLIWSALFHE